MQVKTTEKEKETDTGFPSTRAKVLAIKRIKIPNLWISFLRSDFLPIKLIKDSTKSKILIKTTSYQLRTSMSSMLKMSNLFRMI